MAKLLETFQAIGADIKGIKKVLPTMGLVDNLPYPHISAHRGGANLFPEQSPEGFDFHSQQGFGIEWDVTSLVDGTLIMCHDDTPTRTMLSLPNANTNTLTQAQWRQADMINQVMPEARTARAQFAEQLLDRYGKNALIIFDTKDDDAAFITKCTEAIISRGLQRDLLAQSFTYATSKAFATNGICASWCSTKDPRTDTTPRTFASIRADGIEFLVMNMANITSELVTAAHAAGLKMGAYTVLTPAQQESLIGMGVDIIISNDPLRTSRQEFTTRTQPSLELGPWPGWRATNQSGGTGTGAVVSVLDRPAQPGKNGGVAFEGKFTNAAGADVPPTGAQRNVYASWAGLVSAPCRIETDLRFGIEGAAETVASLGIALFTNTSDPEADLRDGIMAGQRGFVSFLRRSGQIRTYEYVNGAASVMLGATPTTDPVAPFPFPAGIIKTVAFTVTFTATTVQSRAVWRNDAGAEVVVESPAYTVTVPPNKYILVHRFSQTHGEISNTVVTKL